MIKIIVGGIFGRMGQALMSAARDDSEIEIIAGFDMENGSVSGISVYNDIDKLPQNADCAVDFSSPDGFLKIAKFCKGNKVPLVSGTTGLDEEHFKTLEEISQKIPVFYSTNMSLAIGFVAKIASDASKIFQESDIEIIERHHRHKVDAPSGTALTIAKEIFAARNLDDDALIFGRYGKTGERPRNQIAIHSVRGGGIAGEHQIIIAMPFEEVIITHRALDRRLFAAGAIKAIKYLAQMENGLYSIKNILASV